MANVDSGAGGGGTGDDTAEVTVSNIAGTWTFEIALPPWLGRLRPLVSEVRRILFVVRQPLIFVVAVLLGVQVTDVTIAQFSRQAGPLWTEVAVPLMEKGPVAVILDDFLFRTVLRPVGVGLLNFGFDIVTTILDAGIFLANIPLGAAGLSAQGLAAGAGGIVLSIRSFNLALVEPVTALGVGAQPAATAVGVGQIALVAWLGWIAVRSLDFPFINPLGAILAFTRPFRNFFGGLFG